MQQKNKTLSLLSGSIETFNKVTPWTGWFSVATRPLNEYKNYTMQPNEKEKKIQWRASQIVCLKVLFTFETTTPKKRRKGRHALGGNGKKPTGWGWGGEFLALEISSKLITNEHIQGPRKTTKQQTGSIKSNGNCFSLNTHTSTHKFAHFLLMGLETQNGSVT